MCKKFNIKYKNVFENKSLTNGDKYLQVEGEVIESSYLQKIDECIEKAYEKLSVKNPQSHLLIDFTKNDT